MFRSALRALTAVEDLPKLGVSLHLPDLGRDICGNGLDKLPDGCGRARGGGA